MTCESFLLKCRCLGGKREKAMFRDGNAFSVSLSFPRPFKNRPIQLDTSLRTRLKSRALAFGANHTVIKEGASLLLQTDTARPELLRRISSREI